MSSLNFQYLKKYKLLTIFLLVIIFIHLVTPMKMVEGLSNKIQNQVLVGVGVDYQLYTYMGNTWDPIKIPKGLAKNPILLAITLGADGNLYAAGNDFHLYKSSKGGWVKPKQPSATEVIGIATEGNQLVLVGQDYKLHLYKPSSGTLAPMPGETGPVRSVVSFQGDTFGVGKDNKVYKWLNNKWASYDPKATLICLGVYNDQLMGVGTDKKVYAYGGKPGQWKEIPGNKNTEFLSIYGMEHSVYSKF